MKTIIIKQFISISFVIFMGTAASKLDAAQPHLTEPQLNDTHTHLVVPTDTQELQSFTSILQKKKRTHSPAKVARTLLSPTKQKYNFMAGTLDLYKSYRNLERLMSEYDYAKKKTSDLKKEYIKAADDLAIIEKTMAKDIETICLLENARNYNKNKYTEKIYKYYKTEYNIMDFENLVDKKDTEDHMEQKDTEHNIQGSPTETDADDLEALIDTISPVGFYNTLLYTTKHMTKLNHTRNKK